MKEFCGKGYLKRIAIFMAFIMVLTMLPMHTQQVYAKSNKAKVLIWSTYILQTEVKKIYAPDLEEFISKDEVAGYAGVDSISVVSKVGTSENPLHFTGTEDLSEYDLIIVLMPYEALTDTDVSALKNYLNAGGRIVLQGERDGFARYENKVLSDFAGQLGVTFQITINDDDQDNAIINRDSDIMGGQDLVGNELEYRTIGELTYSGDAQVIATSVDKKYPFIVDFPVQKGRITVMSDVNWWHRRSDMLHTPAQLQSAQGLWGKFLSNSIKNMEAVKNGINPNHEHHFNYISQGNKILAYCDETWGASGCEYNGISNAVAVTLLADDAFYSGEAYSGITVEGIDTYNAITKSNLDKSQVSFYQVETKGTTSGGIKLESAPKEKGHYYAAITSNGAQAVAAFSIEGLAHSITIQNGTTEIADSKAKEDTIVTIKADPAPAGKVFDKWVVESGNITLADANSEVTTFTMPDSAVSVKATYTDAPHPHSYGSEWKSDNDNHWHECSCGAKSEEAAHIASDWITDTAATATTDGTKHKECTICHRVLETGTIPAIGVSTYTITASAGENGTISPSGAVRVEEGGSQTFTISPSSGYVIDTIKVDGLEVTATTSYTFRDVNAVHTIEVTFKQENQTPRVWDVIKDEVDKTKDGDTVVVKMNGSSVVPGDVFDEIKGKDVTIVFDMGDGITWSVNGNSITGDKIGDIDFSVSVDTNTIPVDIINNVTGERYSKQISLAYDGEFGFTAVLSINMDKKNAGLYANLFYYNEKAGKMEFICYDEIAEDGTAKLTFTHASDYSIVIDKAPMDGSGNSDNKDDAPDTGDRTPVVWLFVLVVISVTGMILAVKKGRINLKELRK